MRYFHAKINILCFVACVPNILAVFVLSNCLNILAGAKAELCGFANNSLNTIKFPEGIPNELQLLKS